MINGNIAREVERVGRKFAVAPVGSVGHMIYGPYRY